MPHEKSLYNTVSCKKMIYSIYEEHVLEFQLNLWTVIISKSEFQLWAVSLEYTTVQMSSVSESLGGGEIVFTPVHQMTVEPEVLTRLASRKRLLISPGLVLNKIKWNKIKTLQLMEQECQSTNKCGVDRKLDGQWDRKSSKILNEQQQPLFSAGDGWIQA